MVSIYDGADAFDVFFYRTYHFDLKGFSARQARRHFRLFGRREARYPHPDAMLTTLQAQECPLPPDFHSLDYVRLNPDLQQELRHAWQPAEHYLRHGRHHGRRYRPDSAFLTTRSSAEHLRRRLEQAFGEALVDDALVQTVQGARTLAARSGTPAAPLMESVLIARWFLSWPEAEIADFASLRGQLTVVFRVVFELFLIEPRSALEIDVLNRLRTLAIDTTLFEAGPDRPAVTILMLAARAVSEEPFLLAPTVGEAAGLVARFFTRDVPRLGLQRYVTPEQRVRLRGPVGQDDPAPLAAALLEEVEGAQALAAICGPEEARARFLEQGVWFSGMDYVLSAEQLTEAQVQVTSSGGELEVSAPDFLFSDRPGDPQAAQAWLRDFVLRTREDRGLPQSLVAASASACAVAGMPPREAIETPAGGPGGRKPLRVGELATFGYDGAGPRHLIGGGWYEIEETHVWSRAKEALLAINLDPEDVGPLDLFVRFSPGPRRKPRVTVWWNGRPAGGLWAREDRILTLHCHLGPQHRSGASPNILCFAIDELFTVEHDHRHLGIALYDLMLVRR